MLFFGFLFFISNLCNWIEFPSICTSISTNLSCILCVQKWTTGKSKPRKNETIMQKYLRCAMWRLFRFSSLAIMQFLLIFYVCVFTFNAQVKYNHWRRDIRKRYIMYVYMLFFSYVLKILYTDYVITSQEKVIFLRCFCFLGICLVHFGRERRVNASIIVWMR